MKLTFCGAAGEVTGSQHLVESRKLRVLLDCGLFQGHRTESRHKNEQFHCRPPELDCVILSHAHIDHCGNLPGLYRAGFRGPIYCTDPTADMAEIMLQDAARIQAEDVRYLNQHREGKPALTALYDLEDVAQVVKLFEPLPYGTWHDLSPEFRLRFRDAGHILGSAIVETEFHELADVRRLVFTGDLGRRGLPVLKDPELVDQCEILITESTYGDKIHPPAEDMRGALLRLVQEIHQTGGKLVIPAFSLGRTQNVVYILNELSHANQLPRVPIYVDSPLSNRITHIYRRYLNLLDSEAQQLLLTDRDPFDFPGLSYISRQQESMVLNQEEGPMVIIAASGMCESGRILHHLKHTISDPQNIILMIGFQAEHTLGRRIIERHPYIRIFNHDYPLRARVEKLNGFSAHADAEDFRWWLDHLHGSGGVSQSFIVHGEARGAQALATMLQDVCDHEPVIPQYLQTFEV